MSHATFEVTGKFDTESSAQKLLYAPLPQALTCRETQCYKVEYEGDEAALRTFVQKVLLDPISQNLSEGGAPLWSEAQFILEYGMKAAALDLEKETILDYWRSLSEPAFSITRLTLRRRVYVFGEGADPAPFVRDVVNPAIHTSEVYTPAAMTAQLEAAATA
jgi:hypothetical protein